MQTCQRGRQSTLHTLTRSILRVLADRALPAQTKRLPFSFLVCCPFCTHLDFDTRLSRKSKLLSLAHNSHTPAPDTCKRIVYHT